MPQALLMLGGAYSELGRTREAREQFDRVLKDDPQSVQALVGTANLLMREGRTDDVISAVQANAVAGRSEHAGARAPGRGVCRPERSRTRPFPISRRPWRSSPS